MASPFPFKDSQLRSLPFIVLVTTPMLAVIVPLYSVYLQIQLLFNSLDIIFLYEFPTSSLVVYLEPKLLRSRIIANRQ